MTNKNGITRRAALARLGLGAASVYMSPGIFGISVAHAASSVSGSSGSSDASAASPASAVSSPSAASTASSPSASSGASRPSGSSRSAGSTWNSGPSRAGSCHQTSLRDGAQITRRDYERAQQAILRGEARPLRDILTSVEQQHRGQLLRVSFSERDRSPAFRVVIVNRSGAIVSVTVDAGSGQITNVQNC